MAKVRVIPTSARAATTSGCTSKSLNSGLSGATGAPPSSSTCDSSSSGAGAPVSACSRATTSVAAGSVGGSWGVFSVEVSALASGLLGDRLRRRGSAASGLSAVGCRGISSSADAASRPGEGHPPGRKPAGSRSPAPEGGVQRSSAHRYTSEPKGSPIPMVARAPVSLCAPRCPPTSAAVRGPSRRAPGDARAPGRQPSRRRPAGRARLRGADRLRPAGRGRPAGAHPGRPGGAGPHGGGRDRPPRAGSPTG